MHPRPRDRFDAEITPFRGALFALGLAAAIAFWPGIIDFATAPRWAALAVLIPFAFLMRDSSSLAGRKPGLPAALFLPLGVAAFSLAWTPDPMGGIDELAHLIILGAAAWLGAIASGRDLDYLWRGLAIGVAASATLAAFQVFGFESDLFPQAVGPAGLFGNKNVLGEASLVAALVAPSALLFAFAAVGIALATSKAVFGAAALAAAALFFWRGKFAASAALLALIVLAAVAPFALGWYSAAERLDFWAGALANLAPLGHGLGSFAVFNPTAEFAHSEPVQAVFELGLLAIPLAAVFAYALGGGYVRSNFEREALVLVAVLGVGLFSFPLHMPLTALATAMALGHVVASRLRLRDALDVRAAQVGYGG